MTAPKPHPLDALIGKPVRIVRGKHAGKQGIVRRSFRDRVASPDRLMIELDGCLPGWGVSSVEVGDVEVVR
jgi:hypothetical protein